MADIKLRVRRGEVYWADLATIRGSEQDGLRPVLVVQSNSGNDNSPTTVVIPGSTRFTAEQKRWPIHVFVPQGTANLTSDTVFKAQQIRTLDVKNRFRDYIGVLPKHFLEKANNAIIAATGLSACLDCGYPNFPDQVTCRSCGRQLRRRCSACGRPLDLSWSHCPWCGSSPTRSGRP